MTHALGLKNVRFKFKNVIFRKWPTASGPVVTTCRNQTSEQGAQAILCSDHGNFLPTQMSMRYHAYPRDGDAAIYRWWRLATQGGLVTHLDGMELTLLAELPADRHQWTADDWRRVRLAFNRYGALADGVWTRRMQAEAAGRRAACGGQPSSSRAELVNVDGVSN